MSTEVEKDKTPDACKENLREQEELNNDSQGEDPRETYPYFYDGIQGGPGPDDCSRMI